jgi:thiol-disulfide isomerase/thioredoxin
MAMLRRSVLIVVGVLILGLPFGAKAQTPSTITVERIEPAELDKLIKDKDCRCLIIAMAAWCGPCRRELPALVRLNEKYRSQGLKMIGVSLDLDGPQAMQPIVEKYKVNFPVYWVGEEVIGTYNVTAMPTLFLVKNGEIVERIIGKRSEKFLDGKIRNFLK